MKRIGGIIGLIFLRLVGLFLLAIFALEVVGDRVLALLDKPAVEHVHMHPALSGGVLVAAIVCLLPLSLLARVYAWGKPLLPKWGGS